MKLYRFTVGGIAKVNQVDHGKLRTQTVDCYSAEQALAWADIRPYVDGIRVISREEI